MSDKAAAIVRNLTTFVAWAHKRFHQTWVLTVTYSGGSLRKPIPDVSYPSRSRRKALRQWRDLCRQFSGGVNKMHMVGTLTSPDGVVEPLGTVESGVITHPDGTTQPVTSMK